MRLMTQPSRRIRIVVLTAHAALLATLLLPGGTAGLVFALPLLAFVPALWRGTPRAYAAASLLIVFYAGGGLVEALSASARFGTAMAFAAVAVIEFCALMLYVKAASATAAQS